MARTGVHIKFSDTQLGTATPNDSIAMLFCHGTTTSQVLLYTPYLLTQLRDLVILQITESNNPILYKEVKDFYDSAGSGYKLWFVLVENLPTIYDQLFSTFKFDSIIKKTTVGSFDNRPRIIGFKGKIDWASTPSTTAILNNWSYRLIPEISDSLNRIFDEGYGAVAIVDALAIDTVVGGINAETTLSTTLQNLGTLKEGKVAAQITTNKRGDTASIGQTLGRLASVPISTSIGAVNIGPIGQEGFFLDRNTPPTGSAKYINTPVQDANEIVINILGDYQYLFTRSRVSSATSGGVYYNDGATCNSNEFALSSLEFGRVANAVCDDVRGYFNILINQSIPYDPTTGELDSGFVDTMIADLRAKYLNRRILNGEMQDVKVSARATSGDYPATRSIDVTVQIYPVIALQQVFAEVSFTVSA